MASQKKEYIDDDFETGSYHSSVNESTFSLPKLYKSKTFRNSFLIFPVAVVVCIFVYAYHENSVQSADTCKLAYYYFLDVK